MTGKGEIGELGPSVLTAEDVLDFTRILLQALGEIKALREELEPALSRLDVARLSAEHSTAFSLPGVSHVRHGEPVSTVPAISAGAMRGWDDAGGQASPGAASRAPADSAAGPHGSQGNGLSHITTVVDSVAERSPTEAYAGTGGGGAGPSGPGQAGPSEGQPSEQPGADIADSAAASVALGAEPSLADVDAGPSGVLEGAEVLPQMSQTELLAARLDAAVSDALQRVAMGITADISLSSSAWSVRMGLDRLQAALLRIQELETDLRFRAETIFSVNVPALLDGRVPRVSIRPDRPHPPNIPTRPPPSAPRLPPLARATDAPRQREAVRKYVEGLLGVRVPPDLLQRLGPSRVDAAAAVDAVAGISGVEELPVAPPEGQGRAVGGTAPDADLTKGPVVRTRLRDMQRHRMKLAPLGSHSQPIMAIPRLPRREGPGSAMPDSTLHPFDARDSGPLSTADAPLVPGTPSQAPSGPLGATVRGSALSSTSRPTRSARSRYTTPAHSVGGARAASASRAARGGDPGALGSSQKALDPEHGAGRPGTPSREQLGLRQSATSVDYEVARLGDVSGTGKPLRPISIPKQLWEEAQDMAAGTSGEGQDKEHVLVKIFNGNIVEDQAFAVFYTRNQHRWNPIAVLLLELEEWCSRMNIRRAYVDSSVLVPLALATIAKGTLPQPMDLMACIANVQELEEQLKLPGWRFRRPGGMALAATEIQKWWRGYWTRRLIAVWHRAARAVQTQWRLSQVRRRTKQIILEVRDRRDEAFSRIQARFRQQWPAIQSNAHVVVHLPSISLARKDLLDGVNHWETKQNMQIARLTDVMNELVDVIYVCPHNNVVDMDAYWSKLLQIGGVPNPGARFRIVVPENAEILPAHMSLTSKLIFSPKALARIKFFVGERPAYIVPGSMGKEEVDLAVALGYPILGPNPIKAMGLKAHSRRRKVLRTSQVNVAPGVELRANFFLRPTKADEALTAQRTWEVSEDRPMAPLQRLKDLLVCAGVASWELANGRQSAYDIIKISDSIRRLLYHENMTVYDLALSLTKDSLTHVRDLLEEIRKCYPVMTPSEILAAEMAVLMAQHPSSPRWLMKLDDEQGGRGFAYLDVKDDKGLTRELQRIHEADQARDFSAIMDILSRAQAAVRVAKMLESVLPVHAVVCSPLYGRWTQYAEAFIRYGGVMEACPVQVVGSPYVNLLVTPQGQVSVLSTHELVFCPAYHAIGSSFPQQSVPPAALSDASEAVAQALFRAGIVGYVAVSFVALREKGMMRLWAIDFDLSVTPSLCAFNLFHFLVDGEFSRRAGAYLAEEGVYPDTLSQGAPQSTAGALPDEEGVRFKRLIRRCFVCLDMLSHPMLRMMKFPELFSRLRESGLCFDMVRKLGISFNIMDSHTSGCLGCLAVGVTPYDAFMEIKNLLDFVHKHATRLKVAGPHMPDPVAREDVQSFLQQHAAFKFLVQHVRHKAAAVAVPVAQGPIESISGLTSSKD